jgi:hypothetical protein
VSEQTETVAVSVAEKQMPPWSNTERGAVGELPGLVERSCFLTYHEILPEDSSYLYRVSNAAFERHLSFISSMLKGSPAAAPHISFDDGHRSNYENAFSILERFGVKATFFILSGRIGSGANYISWEQAREMSAAGHRLQSHGWSHRLLTQCSEPELAHELADSRREIEQRLGCEVDSISAPGGRWNAHVAEACVRAGYRYLYHSNPWTPAQSWKGLNLQGRLMVTNQMGPEELHRAMQTKGMRRLFLQAKYGAKEGMRSALGDRLYHKIWCWLANWNPEEGMEVQVDGPGKQAEDR